MKVLFTQLGRIGDMILATPMYKLFKEKFEDSEIHVITGRLNNIILENNPYIDKILLYDKKPLNTISLLSKILSSKYDYLIDPKDHFSHESKYIAKLVNADKKIGFNEKNSKVFDINVKPYNKGIHYTEMCLQSLEHFGINIKELPLPNLYLDFNAELYVDDFIKNTGINNYCIINISASHANKMWSNEKWEEVIKYLLSNNESIVLSFAPSERDRAKDLVSRFNKLHLFKSRNLQDTIALVSKSSFVISVDTAVVHICSAFDKPLVVLIKSVRDTLNKFAPLSKIKELVITEYDMEKINPGLVIRAYENLREKLSNQIS